MADIKRNVITVALEEGDQAREYTVQTDNRDMLAYERTRPKQGWPTPDQGGAFTFTTFLAWSAMHRSGDTGLGMKEFMEERCIYAQMEAPQEVDPTRQGQDTAP